MMVSQVFHLEGIDGGTVCGEDVDAHLVIPYSVQFPNFGKATHGFDPSGRSKREGEVWRERDEQGNVVGMTVYNTATRPVCSLCEDGAVGPRYEGDID